MLGPQALLPLFALASPMERAEEVLAPAGEAADQPISPARIASFNAKFGGGGMAETPHIFEIDFSDDPW